MSLDCLDLQCWMSETLGRPWHCWYLMYAERSLFPLALTSPSFVSLCFLSVLLFTIVREATKENYQDTERERYCVYIYIYIYIFFYACNLIWWAVLGFQDVMKKQETRRNEDKKRKKLRKKKPKTQQNSHVFVAVFWAIFRYETGHF